MIATPLWRGGAVFFVTCRLWEALFFHRFVSAANGLRPCLPMIVYLLFKCKFQTAPGVSAMFWTLALTSIPSMRTHFHSYSILGCDSVHRERLFLIQCRPPLFYANMIMSRRMEGSGTFRSSGWHSTVTQAMCTWSIPGPLVKCCSWVGDFGASLK